MTSQEFAIMLHEMPSNRFIIYGDPKGSIRDVIFAYHELYDSEISIPVLMKGALSKVGSTSSELFSFYLYGNNSVSGRRGITESYLEKIMDNIIARGKRVEDCTLFLNTIEQINAYVIDEISDMLKRIGDSAMPFGGCKVIASGDILHLNPDISGYESKLIGYSSPHFFSAKVFPPKGYSVNGANFDLDNQSKYDQFFECLTNVWTGIRVKNNLNKINKLFY